MILVSLVILAYLAGTFTGVIVARRAAIQYRKRWKEALNAWLRERDGTASLESLTGDSTAADYHNLSAISRYQIANERYEKNLPIEDDLKKWEQYEYWYKHKLTELALKQQREKEK